jgi:hypothetical protein
MVDNIAPQQNEQQYDFRQDTKLSNKWKMRFEFFEKNGSPRMLMPTEYRAKLTKLGFRKRNIIMANFFALFFNFIYLFLIGLWKKAIMTILLDAFFFFLVCMTGYGFLMIPARFFIAMRTNSYYYQYKVKNYQDWNL